MKMLRLLPWEVKEATARVLDIKEKETQRPICDIIEEMFPNQDSTVHDMILNNCLDILVSQAIARSKREVRS